VYLRYSFHTQFTHEMRITQYPYCPQLPSML